MTNANTKILLVDDNETKLIANKNIIKNRLNITCKTAKSGKDAIKKFKRDGDYNIVILDILMPELDGFETATQITKYCVKNDIKLPHMISYTVLESTESQEKAIRCGIIDYISGGNQEELLKTVEKWIIFDNSLLSIY